MLWNRKETASCHPGYWLCQGGDGLQGLALVFFIVLFTMLSGCARVSGTVHARADVTPVPQGLTWEASAGPGADWDAVSQVAEILKPALARYGWTFVPSARPRAGQGAGQGAGQEAGRADVLVYISWDSRGPEIVYSEEPDLSLGVGFSSSYASSGYADDERDWPHRYGRYGRDHYGRNHYGRDRYGRYDRRDPYWGTPMRPSWRGRNRSYYDEPSYRMSALYAHVLRVRAVRLTAPTDLNGTGGTGGAGGFVDAAQGHTAEHPATPPYASPLLEGGPLALSYRPLGPRERPLWEVSVTHVGSSAFIRSLLPYLAAAAAEAAGRTAVEQVKVNRDLQVSHD